ncbi:BON domain-containing protein [Halopseudomonas xinjiangensis]|nr:BON domain-containing protein [Halopseudomonas xinjiangensis]
MTIATGCTVASGQKTAGEFVDDSIVSTRVRAALIEDPQVKFREVQVESFKGVVQLSGFVGSRAEKSRAAQVTRGVEGVREVKNDIRVR